jgi:hypothetical protein
VEFPVAATDAAVPACLPLQLWGMMRGQLETCAVPLSWQRTMQQR